MIGSRRSRLATLAVTAATVVSLSGVLPVSAHVTVTPEGTAAGSYTLLRFGVPHGCDGSSTTQIAIQIPEEFATVTPGMNYGWTVEKVMETLATPIPDGHGGEYTERVSEVVYTAKEPLPDGYYDSFLMSVRLPEDAAGTTLYFPTIQTCEEGETAWIQIPEEGQSEDDLESPAPAFTVTEAEASAED
jgi:uncharacterized protein YcnI